MVAVANGSSVSNGLLTSQTAPDGKNNPDENKRHANGTSGRNSVNDPKPSLVVKNGKVRHILAIMALSAIVMANMNRQAYNQALVRMIKKPLKQTASESTGTTTDRPRNDSNSAPAQSDQMSSAANFDGGDEMSGLIANEIGSVTSASEQLPSSTELPSSTTSSSPSYDPDQDGFEWDGTQISLLQAGFSYGYMFFMIPGGRMSEIYGSKWVIFLSGFGSALCSVLTPFIADQSYHLLVASRVLMGLCQTGVSPALYAFCTRWLAPDEASVYLPLIKVGVMIGFMFGSLINGFMPWRTMFYVVGLVGFIWSLMWAFFASSEPRDHRFISRSELKFIEHSLERRQESESKQRSDGGEKQTGAKKSSAAPWLSILSNPVVLAFTFTKFTVKLSTDVQTMQLPMYLRNVFQVSDSLNGLLNGANFAIQACFTGLVAYTAKEMVQRGTFGLQKTGVRVLFQGINNFGMGLGYLLISFNMGSLELVCCAVIFLSISSMFGSGGEAVLPVDLTTEYAASIMAIANSLANVSGIVMPQIVSMLLANQLNSAANWNRVLWFVSCTMICGGSVFTLFVRAELQDFHKRRTSKETEMEAIESPRAMTVLDMEENNGQSSSWTSRL